MRKLLAILGGVGVTAGLWILAGLFHTWPPVATVFRGPSAVLREIGVPTQWSNALGLVPAVILLSIPGILLALRLAPPFDDATRCRRCGHVLRGLSHPRCPECNEEI